MTAPDIVALVALLALVYAAVRGLVAGMRHAVAVERRYVQLLRETERQTRRCPHCGGWFNTRALQDAHEKSCDQRPVERVADGLPTPLQVLDMAFPAYDPPVHEHYRVDSLGNRRPLGEHEWCQGCARDAFAAPEMSADYRRGVLGPWTAA